jgi:hypothetical protein
MIKITREELAVRAHDITVCLEGNSVPEFDLLPSLGLAVRLALHLRGVPAVKFDLLKNVAIHLLDFPASAFRPVVELMAEAEFVKLDMEGKTIKTVIPDVPYYEQLFTDLTDVVGEDNLNESEQLTLTLLHRLSESPLLQDHAYQLGAEKRLLDRVITIGTEGSFLAVRRARGKDVLLSPTYFPESAQAYADLVSGHGSSRLARILDILKTHQGWPLVKVEQDREIAGYPVDDKDIAVLRLLAGEGFIPPPMIETKHSGRNHFLFGPRPGLTRLPAFKRPIYEAAMALVAAARQGQLLPARIRIRSPLLLLKSLKEKKFLNANTEAIEQYRQLALLKVGTLEAKGSGWAIFRLIDRPENLEALDLAIAMVSEGEPQLTSNEEVVLALRQGENYVDSLIGRKAIVKEASIAVDEESLDLIDGLLLRGRA